MRTREGFTAAVIDSPGKSKMNVAHDEKAIQNTDSHQIYY